ncbi:MAG: chemotaxis protein CheW [Anaerolineae bacterium]|nr:chemotaxis protein CheW [Anaerolineae bacterium]
MTFEAGGQQYGLPLENVLQIVGMVSITRLPKSPPIVAGVVDFHGQVIPIVDIHWRLGQAAPPYTLRTPIIVGHLNNRTMGIVVDQVGGVQHLTSEQIKGTGEVFDSETVLQVHHLLGFARLGNALLLLLDPDTFLSSAEEESMDAALSDQQGIHHNNS